MRVDANSETRFWTMLAYKIASASKKVFQYWRDIEKLFDLEAWVCMCISVFAS